MAGLLLKDVLDPGRYCASLLKIFDRDAAFLFCGPFLGSESRRSLGDPDGGFDSNRGLLCIILSWIWRWIKGTALFFPRLSFKRLDQDGLLVSRDLIEMEEWHDLSSAICGIF